MKKQKGTLKQLGKIFLVLLMIFSQLRTPIIVLADELEEKTIIEDKKEESTEETSTENQINNKEESTSENTTLENIKEENTTSENTEQTTEENITTEQTKNEKLTPEEYKYTLTIYGEETTEYTIEDNKVVTIHQEYNAPEGSYKFSNTEETIDFTNKLFGIYTYKYSVLSNEDELLDEKEITIIYNGDNSEILSQYTETAIIGNIIAIFGKNQKMTKSEFISSFDTTNLQNDYNAKIILKNQEGNELADDDEIDSSTIIVLTNDEIEEEYEIYVVGDLNDDGILNIEDSKIVIDHILSGDYDDEEGVPFYTIQEAASSIYIDGIWNENPEIHDTLTNSLVNKTEIYNGEELEVKYYIHGFDKDKLNGIYGIINYNKEVLELTSVEINSLYGDVDKEKNIGRFAYLLDNYNSEDVLMTIKFKAINTGESNISIDNIDTSYLGVKLNLDDSVSTTVNVIEAGTGGDVEPAPEQTTKEETVTQTPTPVETSLRPIALSSDSLIKSLKIKGYEIDFNPHKFEYAIKVKNKVTSLDLEIVLSDPSAKYKVNGNKNFKVGSNTVEIVVTAEDGSTSTYKIDVEREKSSKKVIKEEKEEKNNSSKAIIIALIVLVIIGLIYVIFKDDEDDKK